MVIILLGVLSVSALGKLNFSGFNERGYTDDLTSALRYAQKYAVSTNCAVRVTVTTNSYTLKQPDDPTDCSSDFNTDVPSFGGGNIYSSTAPSGLTTGSATVTFSGLGNADNSYSIAAHNTSICIVGESGYVYQASSC